MARPRWIFGYGSLIWRPSFPHRERQPAYIENWARRFWQASTDHRGLPHAPGRVVTLVPEAAARCWGMAYRVDGEGLEQVLADLDARESGGYERREVEVHLGSDDQRPEVALMYVATSANPNYLGPAPLDAIAAQVRSSEGPSGHNVEYVLRLVSELRAMNADDPHVFALAELLDEAAPR